MSSIDNINVPPETDNTLRVGDLVRTAVGQYGMVITDQSCVNVVGICTGEPFFASPLPLSRLQEKVERLPNGTTITLRQGDPLD